MHGRCCSKPESTSKTAGWMSGEQLSNTGSPKPGPPKSIINHVGNRGSLATGLDQPGKGSQ